MLIYTILNYIFNIYSKVDTLMPILRRLKVVLLQTALLAVCVRAPQPAVPPQRAPRPPAVPGWGAPGPGPAPALARGGAGGGGGAAAAAGLAALPHGLHRVLAALAARVPSLSVRHQLRVRSI